MKAKWNQEELGPRDEEKSDFHFKDISSLRNQLVNTAIFVTAIFSIPTLAASLYRAVHVGWKNVMFLHIFIVLVMLGTAIFHRFMSFKPRAFVILGALFITGSASLLTWGLIGVGAIFLVTFTVFLTILFGARPGLYGIATCLVVIMIVWIGFQQGVIVFDFDIDTYATASSSWIAMVIGFGLFMTIIVTCLGRFYGSLINAIHNLNNRTLALQNANEQLKEEIKERKHIEESLDESEKLFSLFMDYLPAIVFIKDDKSKTLYVNKHMNDILGAKDWIGKDTIDLFPNEVAETMIADDKKSISEGYRRIVETIPDKHGNEHIYATHKFKIDRHGKPHLLGGIALDITLQKRAEEALRNSEARQSLILGSLPMAFYIAQPFGDYGGTWVSDQIERISGFTPEEFMADIHLWASKLHPSDRDRTLAEFDTLINKNVIHVEYRWLAKDGRYRWVQDNAVLVRDDNGEPKEIIGTWLDITERKQAEERLRVLSSVVEQSAHSIAILNLEGTAEYANQQFLDSNGLQPEQVIGKNWRSFILDSYPLREKYPELRDTVIHKGRLWGGEISNINEKGETIWRETTIFPIKDETGNLVKIIFTDNDITPRKRAEEALLESEKRYRSMVTSIHEGVILQEASGKIISWNKSAEEIFGTSEEEALGRTSMDKDWGTIHEDGSIFPGEEHPSMVTLRTGEPCNDVLMGVKRTDGGLSWISINTKPLVKEGDDKPYAVIVSFSDITDKKQAQEEKRQLEAQLLQAQKMEAIGTLAGGIAHDFNNILAAIIGYTELAKMKLPANSDIQSNLDEALKAGIRAKDLVLQILTFSRQTEQELRPIQVKTVAKEALKLLRASLPSTIDIRHNFISDSLVMGDPTQIHQILMNLCANAAHAMQETGGTLVVDMTDIELGPEMISKFPDLKSGPYIQLIIHDTGHGISPDILGRIFDPFFTTKEKGMGTGMGLSVVHGIVKSYGGAIDVYSEEGKGSTLTVFLPIIEKGQESEIGFDKSTPLGTECVLFIDDEEALADMGKKILESLGYETITRTSSVDALEMFKEAPEQFDLVITDMTMPNITGDQLAQKLMAIRQDIPVILCTGFSTRITEEKAKDMGIRAFISKPILKQNMAETIRAVLDGH